jgi:hypothetical protein
MTKQSRTYNPIIMDAYVRYDSDPRVSGIDDFDAFADAMKGLFDDLISCALESPMYVIETPTADSPEPSIASLWEWIESYRDWDVEYTETEGENW